MQCLLKIAVVKDKTESSAEGGGAVYPPEKDAA